MSAVKILTIVISLTAIVALGLTGCAANGSPGPVLVVFRYDDYRAGPVWGSDKRWLVDQGVLEVFRRHQVPLTVAVIPYASDADLSGRLRPLAADARRCELLRQAMQDGVVEIALHGYSHRYLTPEGEFPGLPECEQRRRLLAGKRELESSLDTRIAIFVPPNNAYDETTVKLLAQAGLLILCGSAIGPVGNDDLMYLPATTQWWQLEEALTSATQFPGPSLIVVMLHPFDYQPEGTREEIHRRLAKLDEIVGRVKDMPGVEIVSLPTVASEHPHIPQASHLVSYRRVRSLYYVKGLAPLLHLITGGRSRWVYWPESYYENLIPFTYILIIVGVLLGLLLGWMGRRLAPQGATSRWLRRVVGAIIIATSAVYVAAIVLSLTGDQEIGLQAQIGLSTAGAFGFCLLAHDVG